MAKGFPVSPIVCNLYMKDFERESAVHPPCWYVDENKQVLGKTNKQEFTDRLNSIDDDIKWTTEGLSDATSADG